MIKKLLISLSIATIISLFVSLKLVSKAAVFDAIDSMQRGFSGFTFSASLWMVLAIFIFSFVGVLIYLTNQDK